MRAARTLGALAMLALWGCADHGVAPVTSSPASIVAVTTLPAQAAVGTMSLPVRVRVTDANDNALGHVFVTFRLTRGYGSLSRIAVSTAADGTAETLLTLGTTPALAEVSVLVSGVTPLTLSMRGVAGPTARIVISRRTMRLPPGRPQDVLTATARDMYNNPTGDPLVWSSRDASAVAIAPVLNNNWVVTALRRPAQAYVVASAGGILDSVLVQLADTQCAFASAPQTLVLGGSLAFDSGSVCLHSDDAGAEYAVVATYNTLVTLAAASIDMTGYGVADPIAPFPSIEAAALRSPEPDVSFESGLRRREHREVSSRLDGARAWYVARRPAALRAIQENDRQRLNVNAQDFCSRPDLRTTRVVAITNTAIVLADTANPGGGFTDDEYRGFGIAMDTLVSPLDTAAFGAPSDIDGNGRVVILFTRAVNELTRQGSPSGIVLGFFYLRDLLPRISPFGNCLGSNASEMFYIMVPDPDGTVNANVRTKDFVQRIVVGTLAHEYQHLINASRRMYVTHAPRVDEELWLNEGLSHIAEELVFYRVGGRQPRQNIGAESLEAGSPLRTDFDTYEYNNFRRYLEYQRAPETNSPIADSDGLAMRGAAWAFLRYVADRSRPADGDLWRRLVDSKLTGTPNLDAALAESGLTTDDALRDWAVAVLADDSPAATPAFSQPSWNFVTAMPLTVGGFGLNPRKLTDGQPSFVSMQSGGTSYIRFAVPQNQDALIEITGFNRAPLPSGMRLTVVRIK